MREARAHVGGTTLASYEYDGNGRRSRVTEATKRRLQMYNQAGQLVYETTTIPGQAGETTEYYYLGRHLVAQKTNGVTTYQHTDALGSVTRKTNSAGVKIEDRVYEPYGESLDVSTRSPQWLDGPAYTGHVLDSLTRITYAQGRYYDQLMGRFMSVDPVAPDAGNFNRYWYANNNPFSNIDPDGRKACGKDTTCALERGDWGGSTASGVNRSNTSGLIVKKDLSGVPTPEIKKWMMSSDPEDRLKAARAAMKHFDINAVSGVEYQLIYDPALEDNGLTIYKGGVRSDIKLGPSAYATWSWLGAVLVHELSHALDNATMGGWKDPIDFYTREARTWRRNIELAPKLGNSPAEIDIMRVRERQYSEAANR